MTIKRTVAHEQQLPQRRRRRRRLRRRLAWNAPYILLTVLLISLLSFYWTVQILSFSTNDHDRGIFRSLLEFHQSTRQPMSFVQSDKNVNHDDDIFSIDEPEDPIINPPMSDGNATFSACLLVMDDNHRLAEWLAYHYHVLPLRTLIVSVDPRSKTSPTKVLNRWRGMGLYIEQWTDRNFLKLEIANHVIPDNAELQIKRDRHRMRQKNFYRQCLETLKGMGRTWVTLIDTDEFLVYNHRGGSVAEYEAWEEKQKLLHKQRKYKGQRIPLSEPPPSPADKGQMIHYIHREQAAGHPFFQRPCISCPRLQFGAKESTEQERNYKVPAIIDADRLDTLRYRRHAERQDFVKNGLSKSIMDVSRITKFPRIQSLHRPIKEICTNPWKNEWDSGLRINHYLGSWEAYSFRDDSRRGGERSFEGWVFKAMDANETDDNIRPWISGFVEIHGAEKAKRLLHGSGLPRGYQSSTSKNWTIMFLDEILGMNETKGNENRVAFDTFVRDFHCNKNQSIEGIL